MHQPSATGGLWWSRVQRQSVDNRIGAFVLQVTLSPKSHFMFQELLSANDSTIPSHETLVNALIWEKASQGKGSLGNIDLNSYLFLGTNKDV